MADAKVEIHGLKELSVAFRRVDKTLVGELKVSFRGLAEHVVGVIIGRMPRRSGKAVASVKPRGTTRGAAIAFGGTKAPYMPWLDFGGSTGRGHRPGVAGSGAIKRDMIPDGRYVYPGIAQSRPEIERAVDAGHRQGCPGCRVRGEVT